MPDDKYTDLDVAVGVMFFLGCILLGFGLSLVKQWLGLTVIGAIWVIIPFAYFGAMEDLP